MGIPAERGQTADDDEMSESLRLILLEFTAKSVAGVVWQALHYLEGFRRLGLDGTTLKMTAFRGMTLKEYGHRRLHVYHRLSRRGPCSAIALRNVGNPRRCSGNETFGFTKWIAVAARES